MNVRQNVKLLEAIDNCQDALESYRMMLSDKQDLLMRFDEKDIKHLKKTFDAVDLTEEERMALFSRFACWRDDHYNTYNEIFSSRTIFIDEFVRDCSIKLSDLKMLVKDIDKQLGWHKLFNFLKSKEKKPSDEHIASLINSIINRTPPVYERINALLKFEEISTTKIPASEMEAKEISVENNNALIAKLSSFKNKEKAALENLISTLNTVEEIAIELKEKKSEIDKDKLSTWLNTYCDTADEQKGTPRAPGN